MKHFKEMIQVDLGAVFATCICESEYSCKETFLFPFVSTLVKELFFFLFPFPLVLFFWATPGVAQYYWLCIRDFLMGLRGPFWESKIKPG